MKPMPPVESYVGRENLYLCPAGHRTWTVHVADGVTPFMIDCPEPGCAEGSASQFYQAGRSISEPAPRFEWWQPEGAELKKLHPAERQHVEQGGLLLRLTEAAATEGLAPGRRRTGRFVSRSEAEELSNSAPITTPLPPEPNVYIPQRQAKQVAEELTGKRCRLKSRDGRCSIFVRRTAGHEAEISAATWWDALRRLKAEFKKPGETPPE